MNKTEAIETGDVNKRASISDLNSTPIGLRLSASAIELFENCPRAYVLKYLDKAKGLEQSKVSLVIGNAVHEALEKFHGLPLDDRNAETLEKCLRAVWHRHRGAMAWTSRDEEAHAGRTALSLLARYVEFFDTSVIPLAREEWVSTQTFANGLHGFGKVDRVDAPDDAEGLEVVDYKTGRWETDPAELPETRAAQLYAVGVNDDFGEKVEAVRFAYLPTGRESIWRPSPEEVEVARDSLEMVTSEMLMARDLDATPGTHCRSCAFRRTCPEASAVVLDDLVVPDGIPF